MFNKNHIIIAVILFSSFLFSELNEFSSIPIQESGRIKPLDTYARNQLLLIYGKDKIHEKDKTIEAIDWLVNLLINTEEELKREIFYISSWSNSPEVEISLGLDSLNRKSHRYSFYEIIKSFKNNIDLLENLKLKQEEPTYVEQQIIDIYSKLVAYDEIAHSFKCLLPFLSINNNEIKKQLHLDNNEKVSYAFFVRNIQY